MSAPTGARIIVTLTATGLACGASVVQAPVAGAGDSRGTPDVGIIPFPTDVFTLGSDGHLIDVDLSTTPSRPHCSVSRVNRST